MRPSTLHKCHSPVAVAALNERDDCIGHGMSAPENYECCITISGCRTSPRLREIPATEPARMRESATYDVTFRQLVYLQGPTSKRALRYVI